MGDLPKVNDMSEASLESKLIAEGIGVFALTFIGAGSIIMGGDLMTVALAHGIVLSIVVTATMNVSGGHINPAVTISMMAVKKMDNETGMKYIVAQLVGGLIAGGALFILVGNSGFDFAGLDAGLGTPAPGAGLGWGGVIMIEFFLTFLLLFAIWGTAVDPRAPAIGGWGIGMMVAVDIMMGGPLTGAAMNPARYLGTAAFAGDSFLADSWMYIIGTVAGALACSFLYHNMIMAPEDEDAKLEDHDA